MEKRAWRAAIKVGLIIFLVYSSLLMREFERSGMGQQRGLFWAVRDVLTAANFGIAAIVALVGYIVLEFIRRKF